MQRRVFSAAGGLTAAAAAVAPLSAWAQFVPFKEGADYLKLTPAVSVDAPAGKVEVVELFGYWCPHCAKFEAAFQAWIDKAPAHVAVRRIPVAFRPEAEPLQRMFFVLESLGKLKDLHGKVFHAIHVEKVKLQTADEVVDWVAKNGGLERAKVLEVYQSFAVAGKAKRASQQTQAYQIDGVPSLGVGGMYVTSGTQAKSMERALQVVDHLIGLVRKG